MRIFAWSRYLQKLVSVGAIRRFIFNFFENQNFSRHRKAELLRKWIALVLQVKFRFMGCLVKANALVLGNIALSLSSQLIKHGVVVIIAVNSISFYETAICREIFSKHFFASTSLKFLQRIRKTFFKKFLENSQKNTRGESYFTKVAGFYRSSQRRCSIKKVS